MFQTEVVERIKTHILCSGTFFSKIVPFMRKCGENIVERDRSQMTIWRMLISCCIRKATNTHPENVMLIAFPQHQWLRERAAMLLYAYIACLVSPCPVPLWSMLNLVLNGYWG